MFYYTNIIFNILVLNMFILDYNAINWQFNQESCVTLFIVLALTGLIAYYENYTRISYWKECSTLVITVVFLWLVNLLLTWYSKLSQNSHDACSNSLIYYVFWSFIMLSIFSIIENCFNKSLLLGLRKLWNLQWYLNTSITFFFIFRYEYSLKIKVSLLTLFRVKGLVLQL